MRRVLLLLAFVGTICTPYLLVDTSEAGKPKCDVVSLGSPFCATHYHATIAGVALGESLPQVTKALGRPLQRTRRSPGSGNCPFANKQEYRQRPLVQKYESKLSIGFERYSYSRNICQKHHRKPQPRVFEVVSRSPRDNFPNGIHVGSSLRTTKRLFHSLHITCYVGRRYQRPGSGYCVFAVQKPAWLRRDDEVVAGMILMIHHRRVALLDLKLWKAYS